MRNTRPRLDRLTLLPEFPFILHRSRAPSLKKGLGMSFKHPCVLAAAFVVSLVVIADRAATDEKPKNLLENGGFEKVEAGRPVGWIFIADEGHEVRAAADTEKPKAGRYCLHLEGGASWAAAVAERRIAVQKDKEFLLTGFVRVTQGQAFIKFDYFDGEAHLGQTLSEIVSDEKEWKELKVTSEQHLYPIATHIVATVGGLYELEADFDEIVMSVK